MSSHRLEESLKMGKIPLENTAVFLCDLQEKFRPAMLHYSEVITNAKKLVESTKILGLPLIVTEQYPQGLGSTVSEIKINHAAAMVAKTKFSMIVPEVENVMKTTCNGQLKCVILFGVEAHVCVEQTAIDLISSGITVHIVADATTSRTQEDRLLALERLKQIGCFITTSESIIYKLLGDKNHPNFNEIRPLIKDTTLETGLVSKMHESTVTSLPWQYQLELIHSVLVKLLASDALKTEGKAILGLVKKLIVFKTNSAVIQEAPMVCDRPNKAIKNSTGESAPSKRLSKEKSCSICCKSFARPQDLRRHLISHDETSSFLCEECGKSYRSSNGLNYHKALNHPNLILDLANPESGNSDQFTCPECSKTCGCQIQLKVHLKNSHRRAKATYTCTICVQPKDFERKDVFKKHLALHERPKAFTCLICARSFSSRSNLTCHTRTFHDNSVSLQCPTCSKKFYSKKKLNSHVSECLARKCCTSCKFFCQREEELTEHMKKAHPADYAIQEVFGHNLEGLG